MKILSMVVPAFNEARRIETSLQEIVDFFSAKDWDFEVIVSDDGSTDGTIRLSEEFAAENREVTVLKNLHKGKGHAVWQGVMHSSGQYIYLSDADLSTPIEDFEKLFAALEKTGADVVVASREGLNARRLDEPFYRHFMGRVFNFLVQALTVRGIRDTQCGFKLLKSEQAKKIFSQMQLYNENSPVLNGPAVTAYDVELLFLAEKLGMKVVEVPVTWVFKGETKVDPLRDTWRNFWDVVKVRLNDLTGKYA